MITYKLQRPQENFIKKKLIPMLDSSDEDKIIWKDDEYHINTVIYLLNQIILKGEYTERESELMNDLRIVYQKTKN